MLPRSLRLVKPAVSTLQSRPRGAEPSAAEREALWQQMTVEQRTICLYWMRRFSGASARQAVRSTAIGRSDPTPRSR